MDTGRRFSNHDVTSTQFPTAFTSSQLIHFYFLFLFSLLVYTGCQAELIAGVTSQNGEAQNDVTGEFQLGLEGLESCVVDVCRRVRKQRPVCGSDGNTYPSKCHLRAVNRCRGSKNSSDAADTASEIIQRISNKPCSAETRCEADRRSALFDRSIYSSADLYVPHCSPLDGSFMPLQCHNATGYCWCVTRQGRPLPGSSVSFLTSRPACPTGTGDPTAPISGGGGEGGGLGGGIISQHNLQQGSTGWSANRRINMAKKRRRDGTKKRRATVGSCNGFEKVQFSMRLIELFEKEFTRSQPVPSTSKSSHRSTEIATWKFRELDVDKDGRLRRKELRNLRRMSIKFVKPRPCAQTFQIYCDVNNDKRIELPEWTNCLANHTTEDQQGATDDSAANHQSSLSHVTTGGRDSYKKPRLGHTSPNILRPNGKAGGGALTDQSDELKSGIRRKKKGGKNKKDRGSVNIGDSGEIPEGELEENPTESFLTLISKEGGVPSQSSTNQRTAYAHNRPSSAHVSDASAKRSSCPEERKKAVELDRVNPRSGVFVPECDPDGTFRRAQCHNSTGYCWCVEVLTGIPIPGISSRYQIPDCSQIKHRQFKGCAFTAKKRFLTLLLDRMTQQMVEHINNNTAAAAVAAAAATTRNQKAVLGEPDPEQSIEERAVRWKLATLDSNGNQILERRELRGLRQELKKLGGGGTAAGVGEGAVSGEREEGEGRKCRRNFLRYCDEDGDGNIHMREWIDCTELNEKHNNLPDNPRRKGRNPFSSVLKSN